MTTYATQRTLPKRPLPWRITAYLQRQKTPQHLNDIARAIHASRLATANAVHRMARDGRVRWVGEGTYALGEKE
jgi:Mn-dependent DtxR family transcriptional regulator